MGEIEEAMLDGTLCACCGEYLGDDAGYPIYCAGCAPDFDLDDDPEPLMPRIHAILNKIECPHCGKRVRRRGLEDHCRVKHPPLDGA